MMGVSVVLSINPHSHSAAGMVVLRSTYRLLWAMGLARLPFSPV